MNQNTNHLQSAAAAQKHVNTTETFPVAGTTMVWDASSNSLEVFEDDALVRTYDSGSVLAISIDSNGDYAITEPGTPIADYNFNKKLSHENTTCFSIASRTGIGVMDFRDFRLKDTWDIAECGIGMALEESYIWMGYPTNSAPCFTEVNDPDATCDH